MTRPLTSFGFDISSVRHKLRYMVEKGLLTIDQLDTPSPGFKMTMNVHLAHFPTGYHGVRHKNLLRDS